MNNNVYMVLSLIYLKGQLSGYQLNKLISQRGYRSWADIRINFN